MARLLIYLLVYIGGLIGPVTAQAGLPDEVLQDPVLEQRARAISKGLRCVVCQNQSIDDSDAPLARDMRLLVRERLLQGDTDSGVRDYIVSRYGHFVLMQPPLQKNTLILWFAPALFLLLAFGGFALYLRGRGIDAAGTAGDIGG